MKLRLSPRPGAYTRTGVFSGRPRVQRHPQSHLCTALISYQQWGVRRDHKLASPCITSRGAEARGYALLDVRLSPWTLQGGQQVHCSHTTLRLRARTYAYCRVWAIVVLRLPLHAAGGSLTYYVDTILDPGRYRKASCRDPSCAPWRVARTLKSAAPNFSACAHAHAEKFGIIKYGSLITM